MANNVKITPVGIDWYIQYLQSAVYSSLISTWNLSEAEWESYGRCYRDNDDKGNYSPMVFIGSREKEYKPMVVNDKVTVTSFYDVSETIKVGNLNTNTATVYAIFFVNLAKLGLTQSGRSDEEFRKAVQDAITKSGTAFQIEAIQIGSRSALAQFAGNWKKDQLTRDEQPFHIFRVDMVLANYLYDKQTCN